jgi:hypothetical protein
MSLQLGKGFGQNRLVRRQFEGIQKLQAAPEPKRDALTTPWSLIGLKAAAQSWYDSLRIQML